MPNDFQTIPNQIPKQASSPVVITSAPLADIVRTFNILTIPSVKQPADNPYKGKVKTSTPDPGLYLSPLGTPVMQDITFKSVTYTDFITGQKRTVPDLTLICILLNVNQAKKIITTEIQGRDGTVKEYIGMDDFAVTINGILVADNGKSPADQIITLKNTLIARVAIPVVCTYLNNLGIFNLVVKEFSFDQEAGGYSKQNFTINCISDVDVILQIL